MRLSFLFTATMLSVASCVLPGTSLVDAQLLAQGKGPARTRTITVALVDSLPTSYASKGYATLILRRAGAAAKAGDVILLPRGTANRVVLDAAVRTLMSERGRQPNPLVVHRGKQVQTITIGVRATPAPPAWTARYGAGQEKIIAALLAAPVRDVPGLGRARAVDFAPPRLTAASQ